MYQKTVQVMCGYSAIFCRTLEHLQILASLGVPGTYSWIPSVPASSVRFLVISQALPLAEPGGGDDYIGGLLRRGGWIIWLAEVMRVSLWARKLQEMPSHALC